MPNWWDNVTHAVSGAASAVGNAVGSAAHAVGDAVYNAEQPINHWLEGDGSNNFFTGSTSNSLPSLVSGIVGHGASVNTGFGSGAPTGTSFQQGMNTPAPAPMTDGQLDQTVNDAVGDWRGNNPSVTTPSNAAQVQVNPTDLYSPVVSPPPTLTNTPSPTWGASNPGPAGTSTSADVSTPPANALTTGNGTTNLAQDWQKDLVSLAPLAGGVISAVGSAAAAGTEAQAAKDAAEAQKSAAQQAIDLQRDQFNKQQENIKPWLDAGRNALGQLTNLTTNPTNFSMSDFQMDPGYKFRLDGGLKALQNSAAARGQLLSGNTMKGITNYGQNAASQEYQNAFNRYMTQKGQNLNALQSLAGVGQTAVQQVGQAGQNYANNAGNATMAGGNALAQGITGSADARASGYMGGTNALNNALSGYANNYQSQTLLNNLLNKGN